jgi:hypothetical protein
LVGKLLAFFVLFSQQTLRTVSYYSAPGAARPIVADLRKQTMFEQKLLAAANTRHCTTGMYELQWNIIILARDTGMRNQRELYRIRVENLAWDDESSLCRTARRPKVER